MKTSSRIQANLLILSPIVFAALLVGIYFESSKRTIQYWVGVGSVGKVSEYILRGGDVNVRLDGNYTLLMVAVINRKTDVASLLMGSNAEIDAVNDRRETALHLAVSIKSREFVTLLIDHGANMTYFDRSFPFALSPFETALRTENIDLIEPFVDHGVSLDSGSVSHVTNPNVVDYLNSHK